MAVVVCGPAGRCALGGRRRWDAATCIVAESVAGRGCWARESCSLRIYDEGLELPCALQWLLQFNSCAASRTAYTVQVSARESGTKTLGGCSPKQQQQGSLRRRRSRTLGQDVAEHKNINHLAEKSGLRVFLYVNRQDQERDHDGDGKAEMGAKARLAYPCRAQTGDGEAEALAERPALHAMRVDRVSTGIGGVRWWSWWEAIVSQTVGGRYGISDRSMWLRALAVTSALRTLPDARRIFPVNDREAGMDQSRTEAYTVLEPPTIRDGSTMNIVARLSVLSFLAVGVSGCRASEQDTTTRATTYRIDERAPVKSEGSIIVFAPSHTVWNLITDIDRWSSWRPEVTASHLDGALAAGTPFTWTVDGTGIKSQIAAVDGQKRIAWTGHAMGLTAIHVWMIEPLGPNKTSVRTKETMTGFPSSLFYSSADLQEANAKWLSDLKHASEKADTSNNK